MKLAGDRFERDHLNRPWRWRHLEQRADDQGAPLDGNRRWSVLITNAFYPQYQPLPRNWPETP